MMAQTLNLHFPPFSIYISVTALSYVEEQASYKQGKQKWTKATTKVDQNSSQAYKGKY
jgi:hypothetical protein